MYRLSCIVILLTLLLAMPLSVSYAQEQRLPDGGHLDDGLNPNQIVKPDPHPDATESSPPPDIETSQDLENYINKTDQETEPGD